MWFEFAVVWHAESYLSAFDSTEIPRDEGLEESIREITATGLEAKARRKLVEAVSGEIVAAALRP